METARAVPLLLVIAALAFPIGANRAEAAPTLWSGNGHYYEVVLDSQNTWPAAKSAAEAATHNGLKGHLATITSSGEDVFVTSLVQGAGLGDVAFYLGGHQAPGSLEPGGGWQWVTGEPFAYANWSPGEPNDSGGTNENVLVYWGPINAQGALQWCDGHATNPMSGYVIEFEAATVLGGRERRISNNDPLPLYQSDYYPSISGNIIAFSREEGGGKAREYSVWYHDLSSGQQVQVTTPIVDPMDLTRLLPDVSDGLIAWESDPFLGDVLVYSVVGVNTVNLTSDTDGIAHGTAIGQGLVAWSDGNFEIYARELSSGEQRRITNHPDSDTNPSVSDRLIAWESWSDSGTRCGIRLHDWTTGLSAIISGPDFVFSNPDLHHNKLVFEAYDASTWPPVDRDIIYQDLATGEQRRIPRPGNQQSPHISGDCVSYDDVGVDGRSHIKVWHLPTNKIFTIDTGTDSQQFLGDIDGNRIVYTDDRDDWLAIYLYEFSVTPPVAKPGANQTVHAGTPVNLDGSGSSDPDGNYPLTYVWRIVTKPAGSAVALSDPTVVGPSFTPDVQGDYILELVVTDALQLASAPASVTISTYNTPPVADAGSDQSIVFLNSVVMLDGTKSYDDDGDPITHTWTMMRPVGSTATLSDPAAPTPTFVADVHGEYTCTLIVKDSLGAESASDSVTVSFTNVKPVADAGGNQTVSVGTPVVLDGSGSTDANGDPLTYRWSLVTRPEGSQAAISCNGCHTELGPGNPHPQATLLTPDVAGQYVVSLVVNDGFEDSDADNVTITATSSREAVIDKFPPLVEAINDIPADAFKNENLRNALTNKIAAALSDIDKGNYAEALSKLENDILKKTDGCADLGMPDKNDWITQCDAQAQVYPLLMEIISFLHELI